VVTNKDTTILFRNDEKLSGYTRLRQSMPASLGQILPLDPDRFRHFGRAPTRNFQNRIKALSGTKVAFPGVLF
jgi:hypothetical protein